MRLSPTLCMENRTSFSVLGFYFKKGATELDQHPGHPTGPICVGDAGDGTNIPGREDRGTLAG